MAAAATIGSQFSSDDKTLCLLVHRCFSTTSASLQLQKTDGTFIFHRKTTRVLHQLAKSLNGKFAISSGELKVFTRTNHKEIQVSCTLLPVLYFAACS